MHVAFLEHMEKAKRFDFISFNSFVDSKIKSQEIEDTFGIKIYRF